VLGVFLLYFLCINTEGVFLNILFLGLLGKWQPEDAAQEQTGETGGEES
jgi:hypothetical protein